MTTTITSITAILLIVGQWFILEKMGEKGWKAFVPFYGTYLILKRAWNTKMYWAILALIAVACISGIAGTVIVLAGNAPLVVAMILVAIAAGITAFVIDIKFIDELCGRFEQDVGYTAGMLFLDPIFILILGIGIDEFLAL